MVDSKRRPKLPNPTHHIVNVRTTVYVDEKQTRAGDALVKKKRFRRVGEMLVTPLDEILTGRSKKSFGTVTQLTSVDTLIRTTRR